MTTLKEVLEVLDVIKQAFDQAMQQDKQELHCVSCKEKIDYSNTRTKEGWDEVHISGLCEKCFDNSTFCLEDGLYALDSGILSILGNGVILAGGSLRALVDPSDTICDYDLFFTDTSKISYVQEYLLGNKYSLIFQCPKGELSTYFNAESKTKVQLITKRQYNDMQDLISSFDITACCCAYDGETFEKNDRFIFDVLNKLININKIEYPVATMKRIAKYSQKGYTLTSAASLVFVQTVNTMQLDDSNLALYID